MSFILNTKQISKIQSCISNINLNENSTIELEFRLREFETQGLRKSTFYKLRDLFDNLNYIYDEFQLLDTYFSLNINDQVQKLRITKNLESEKYTDLMEKISLKECKFVNNFYNVKTSLSIEHIYVEKNRDVRANRFMYIRSIYDNIEENPKYKDKFLKQLENNEEIILERKKIRYSYIVPYSYNISSSNSTVNINYIIDLTEVEEYRYINGEKEEYPQVRYEFEIELKDAKSILNIDSGRYLNDILFKHIYNIQRLDILDYISVYDKKIYTKIINNINSLVNSNKNIIDSNVLYNSRNLHFSDIVWGGLIQSNISIKKLNIKLRNKKIIKWNNIITTDQNTQDFDYRVTYKTDGLRRILYVHNKRLWLISTANDINILSDQIELLGEYEGMILEGELVYGKNLKPYYEARTEYERKLLYFFVYDSLSQHTNYEKRKEIRNDYHTERMAYAQFIVDKINNVINYSPLQQVIQIQTKQFFPILKLEGGQLNTFENPNQFYTIIEKILLDTEVTIPYKTDGLIFTPIQMPYNFRVDLSQNRSNLTKLPDIVKWKPLEDLTIDFSIYRLLEHEIDFFEKKNIKINEDISFRLYVGHGDMFKGTSSDLYNGYVLNSNYEIENYHMSEIPDGTVIEFAWNQEVIENGYFYPIKIRWDKVFPNSKRVAEDIWRLIHDPINKNTLTGNNDRLMRKYFNRIKRKILNESSNTLLDLGSGRGSDISKWNKYSKVIAVEPNENNIKLFIERAKSILGSLQRIYIIINEKDSVNSIEQKTKQANRYNNKILIIKTGAQNYELITQVVKLFIRRKVKTITSMLSMSFLWKSKETLEGFEQTIYNNLDKNGKFIFVTIDGSRVKDYFNRPMENGFLSNFTKFGKTTLEYKKGQNEILIYIPNSIVSPDNKPQLEYLVDLNEFKNNMEKHSIFLENQIHQANEEKFMSDGEYTYSSLFSYGIFINKEGVNKSQYITTSTQRSPRSLRIQHEESKLQSPSHFFTKSKDINISNLNLQFPTLNITKKSLIEDNITITSNKIITSRHNIIYSNNNLLSSKNINISTLKLIFPTSDSLKSPLIKTIKTIKTIPTTQTIKTIKTIKTIPTIKTIKTTPTIKTIPTIQTIPTIKTIPTIQTTIISPIISLEKLSIKDNKIRLLPLPEPIILSKMYEYDESNISPSYLDNKSMQKINCTWWKKTPVIRIGCLGDGSCLIHSMTYLTQIGTYMNPNLTDKQQYNYSQQVRDYLVQNLNALVPGKTQTQWEKLNKLKPRKKQTQWEKLNKLKPRKKQTWWEMLYKDLYSPEEILSTTETINSFDINSIAQRLSKQYLGDESVGYLSLLYNINIIILEITNEELYPTGVLSNIDNVNTIFIGHIGDMIGGHFEAIGIVVTEENKLDSDYPINYGEEIKYLRTIFSPNDLFIKSYKLRKDFMKAYRYMNILYNKNIENDEMYIRINELIDNYNKAFQLFNTYLENPSLELYDSISNLLYYT